MYRLMTSFFLCTTLLACSSSEPNNPAPPTKAPKAAMDHSKHTAPPEAAAKPKPKPEEKPAAPVVTDDGTTASVALNGSDQMKYNTDRIEVAAGRTVKLTLTHTGRMPAAAMGHNFVLLKSGTDAMAFSREAITAKDTNYVPAGLADKVIANTTVVGGGESVTIEFPAPPPGTYTFLCTFPGHAALMKGEFIVTP